MQFSKVPFSCNNDLKAQNRKHSNQLQKICRRRRRLRLQKADMSIFFKHLILAVGLTQVVKADRTLGNVKLNADNKDPDTARNGKGKLISASNWKFCTNICLFQCFLCFPL